MAWLNLAVNLGVMAPRAFPSARKSQGNTIFLNATRGNSATTNRFYRTAGMTLFYPAFVTKLLRKELFFVVFNGLARSKRQRLSLIVATAASLIIPMQSLAKDFGAHGPLWDVGEPSLIDSIKARLGAMQDSGELDQMRDEMQTRTRAYANRPTPVLGLLRAEADRAFDVDMSITLNRDLMDHRGRVFARAGTHINPLHYSHFNQRIVVLDGDDPEQVAFALSEGTELDTLLVLINGAPLELMRAHGRRFFFDQQGQIVERFGLTRVPSEIMRSGEVMRVREIAVGAQVKQ